MTIRRLFATGMLSAFLLASMSWGAAADMVDCYFINGEWICWDIPVQVVEIKIPDDGDPPPEFDISSILTLLQQVLGENATNWYMGDATGEHSFLFDMERGVALQLQQPAGPGF